MSRSETRSVRLQPADPFDLIRWLARTQSDPRKAVAELVQNSIDARARHVRIERRTLRGAKALVVSDDGEGVLPEMEREEALRFIARNIGHSRKRGLSPRERHDLMVKGQYGIGLLGFWAVGHRMEIRSRVAGSPLHVLRLVEEEPTATLAKMAATLDAAPTLTEVVVFELHDPALRALGGRRLCDYLTAELRGSILGSGVRVEIRDTMARGTAQKHFVVAPKPFAGERLDLPSEVAVNGHSPVRVEIYLARGADAPAIQVACDGTLVADDIGQLASLGLAEPPWVGSALTGLLDFAGFTVPPGTRRGVVPDAAAAAFVRALESLRPLVEAELGRLDRERRAAVDRQVVLELRRALRGFARRLPHYELPPIADGGERASEAIEAPEAPAGATVPRAAEAPPEPIVDTQPELFPPGPLASASIVPELVRVAPGGERRVAAQAADEAGRRIRENVAFAWSVEGEGLSVRGEGSRTALAAAGDARDGGTGTLRVHATQDGHGAGATARVVVAAAQDVTTALGIPEPELVYEPNASWRSRYDGARWEVNAAHEDYVMLHVEPRARLRYLLALLAKEIVNRSYAAPGGDILLERLVEILAHAERNLRGA